MSASAAIVSLRCRANARTSPAAAAISTASVAPFTSAPAPLARDAVSAVYACRDCPAGAPVTWRVEIESIDPDRVDVVTLAPPG